MREGYTSRVYPVHVSRVPVPHLTWGNVDSLLLYLQGTSNLFPLGRLSAAIKP